MKNCQVGSADIFSPSVDKTSSSSKSEKPILIGQVRLVDYFIEGTKTIKTYPGIVVKSKIKNGQNGYMLKFNDTEKLCFVPTDELLQFPIQNEDLENIFDKPSDDPSFPSLVNRSPSNSVPVYDSDDELSDKDVDFIERERLSILDENSDDNDPIVFDCNIKSKNKFDDTNELVPILDDFHENFQTQNKKSKIELKKESKLKKKNVRCQQTTHISRQHDEKRTLSSFVGSKMSHTPCGPDQPNGTKQDCWR